MEKQYVTKEGLEKFINQLQSLKEKRREITDRIQTAKELGDLSENAEYSEAKEAQAMNEGEIARLEEVIKNAHVIQKNGKNSTIQIGSTVTVKMNNKEMTYTIVGSNEASPTEGKISNVSPLGKTFLGKSKGDTANIKTPKGATTITILKIS